MTRLRSLTWPILLSWMLWTFLSVADSEGMRFVALFFFGSSICLLWLIATQCDINQRFLDVYELWRLANVKETLKITSGGQTGPDRSALDVALELSIPCSGWCPLTRLAEDGTIPAKYPLQETGSIDYRSRTLRNVDDASAVLILCRSSLGDKGTFLTVQQACLKDKPILVIDLDGDEWELAALGIKAAEFIREHQAVMVAGPRESQQPGIQKLAYEFLKGVLGQVVKG